MPSRAVRFSIRLLGALLLLVRDPAAASSQQRDQGPPLRLDIQSGLLLAARNDSLQDWQRTYMLELAEQGQSASPAPEPTLPVSAQAVATGQAQDGEWIGEIDRRFGHSAIYDPIRDRMIVFGGQGPSGKVNDTWALSLVGTPAWTRLAPTGPLPSARRNMSAIYDPVRDRIVMFGGLDQSGVFLNDLWALSLLGGMAWTQLAPNGTPPSPRCGHTAIYDPVRDRVAVFGGLSDASGTARNDVWSLSLGGVPTWTPLAPSGTSPSVRYFHSAVFDSVRNRMLVFGGTPALLNDVWALTLSSTPTWTRVLPAGLPPGPRYGQSAVVDPAHNRMIVFGGVSTSPTGFLNECWELSLAGPGSWTKLLPAGQPPVARYAHSAVYDPVRSQMIVFAGDDAAVDYRNDSYVLSLNGIPEWSGLALIDPVPFKRAYASAILDPVRSAMVMFGGMIQGGSVSDEVWALPLASTLPWTRVATTGGAPRARYGHTAVYDALRERMIVFGGSDALPNFFNDVWALSLAGTPTWTQLTPVGIPPQARVGHGAVYDPVRDRMIVFGGDSRDSGVHFNDTWELSLSGVPTWSELVPSGTPPSPRGFLRCFFDPARDRLIMFGGRNDSGTPLNDAWELQFGSTPLWTQLQPTGALPNGWAHFNATYDPFRNRLTVFGGGGPTGTYTNDLWALSLDEPPAWTSLSPAGDPPSARAFQCEIYDPIRDRIVLFGGLGSAGYLGDVWVLAQVGVLDVGGPGPPRRNGILGPPIPNPTRGPTTLNFSLPTGGRFEIGIYDLGGRLVRTLLNSELKAESGNITWDGRDSAGLRLGAGVYFVALAGSGARFAQRVVLLK